MVILLPIGVQPFIKGDKLLEERVALTVRAGGVGQRERSQFQMQFAHLLDDGVVLHIESLDLVGQLVMVSTLAGLELIGRLLLLDFKVAVDHNLVHLSLHLLHLFMGNLLQTERKALLQLVLDEGRIALGISHQVAVHDLVARQLQQQQGTLGVVALVRILCQPRLYFIVKLGVHSLHITIYCLRL